MVTLGRILPACPRETWLADTLLKPFASERNRNLSEDAYGHGVMGKRLREATRVSADVERIVEYYQ